MKSISNCCYACLSISIKNESQFFEQLSPFDCVCVYLPSFALLLTQLYSLSRCRHYSAGNSAENLRELAAAH